MISYIYIFQTPQWCVRIYWKMSEAILSHKNDIEGVLNSYQPAIAVDLVNFSSNQIKFYSHSWLCHLMRVGRETKREREGEAEMHLQGLVVKLKVILSNSHLLSCWPVGKSNAIRLEKRPLSSWSLSSKSSPGLQSIISPLHLTLHQSCVKHVHWWQCVRPHW